MEEKRKGEKKNKERYEGKGKWEKGEGEKE